MMKKFGLGGKKDKDAQPSGGNQSLGYATSSASSNSFDSGYGGRGGSGQTSYGNHQSGAPPSAGRGYGSDRGYDSGDRGGYNGGYGRQEQSQGGYGRQDDSYNNNNNNNRGGYADSRGGYGNPDRTGGGYGGGSQGPTSGYGRSQEQSQTYGSRQGSIPSSYNEGGSVPGQRGRDAPFSAGRQRDNTYGREEPNRPGMGGHSSSESGRGYAGTQPGSGYDNRPPMTHSSSDHSAGGYNSSEARKELSPEEEEEEEVMALKTSIRQTKQESVASTENSVRNLQRALDTGYGTMERLGQQGEMLFNTEKNLNIAGSHQRTAASRTDELRRINRSMFIPVAKSKSKHEKEQGKIMAQHELDMAERELLRKNQYEAQQRVGGALNNPRIGGGRGEPAKRSMADRSRYQFEADEEDNEQERRIEDNLDTIYDLTGQLKTLGMNMGKEVDYQNEQIDRVANTAVKVDHHVTRTTHQLNAIR